MGLGRLTFFVIDRGGRLGIRVKDPNSPVRTGFPGLEYYPIDYSYRFDAEFVPYATVGECHFNLTDGRHRQFAPALIRYSERGAFRDCPVPRAWEV